MYTKFCEYIPPKDLILPREPCVAASVLMPILKISSIVYTIAFGVSFNLNLESESPWTLFNGTWQKRPRELDHRLRFDIEEISLQMQ